MSLQEKMDFIGNMACTCSIIVQVFVRRKVGFRVVSPVHFVPAFLFVSFIGVFLKNAPINCFALLFLGVAILQMNLRFNEVKRGFLWHSYSGGESWLKPIFGGFVSELNINRFIDPLVCLLFSGSLSLINPSFGQLSSILCVASIMLIGAEQYKYMKAFDFLLDQQDAYIDSHSHKDLASYLNMSAKQGNPQAQPQPLRLVSTGVDQGLREAMKRRNG